MIDASHRKRWAAKALFSTGEAAELCGLSQQTIIRSFDEGRLRGFRVPGSRYRRIPRAELIRFMRAHGIPTDALESTRQRILVVDDDPEITSLLATELSRDQRLEIRTVSTGFDAGAQTQQFRPHLIILDLALPDLDGQLVCRRIKSDPELHGTRVLIISGALDRGEQQALAGSGADCFLGKPFTIDAIMERLEALLGLGPA